MPQLRARYAFDSSTAVRGSLREAAVLTWFLVIEIKRPTRAQSCSPTVACLPGPKKDRTMARIHLKLGTVRGDSRARGHEGWIELSRVR